MNKEEEILQALAGFRKAQESLNNMVKVYFDRINKLDNELKILTVEVGLLRKLLGPRGVKWRQ